MDILKGINFLVNIFLLKYETEIYSQVKAEYLFKTHLDIISKSILDKLGDVLGSTAALVVSPKSDSLLGAGLAGQGGDFILIQRGLPNITPVLRKDIPRLDKDLTYFFIDGGVKDLIGDFDTQRLTYHIYKRSINFVDEPAIVNEFISMFYKTVETPLNVTYREIEASVSYHTKFKEVVLKSSHIGTIRSTIYHQRNPMYEAIKRHFLVFYSDVTGGTLFVNLSEKYIKSLVLFLVEKGFLTEDISGALGAIEDLFPFSFYKGMVEPYTANNIVSGGVCFDRIISNPFLKKYVNTSLVEKYGASFIVSGVVRNHTGRLSMEVL